jgi:hypothetical protein
MVVGYIGKVFNERTPKKVHLSIFLIFALNFKIKLRRYLMKKFTKISKFFNDILMINIKIDNWSLLDKKWSFFADKW